MSEFEILEHTADIGFQAWGANPAELFENAALAMLSIAGDPGEARPLRQYPLAASGEDYESLMVNWLSEVLYYSDARRIAFGRFRVSHIDCRSVQAIGWGEECEAARHGAKVIIKAVTYHQLSVTQTSGRWAARVFLDI